MRARSHLGLALFGLALILAVVAVAIARPASPATAQGSQHHLAIPFALSRFEGPLPTPVVVTLVPTAPASPTQAASATSAGPTHTQAPASATPGTGTPGGGTPTGGTPGLWTPTAGPTPTPTLPGGEVAHSTDPGDIILQIGFTETIEISQVWEEMNGTPWFTLYGDGRVIAQHALVPTPEAGKPRYPRQPELHQVLYEGRVTEYEIQKWLRALTYTTHFFTMKDSYEHPTDTKPWLHAYVNATGGAKRVNLYGFQAWQQYPVRAEREPDMAKIKSLIGLVLEIEAFSAAHISEPFTPECYTLIMQELPGNGYLADPPQWERRDISIRSIANAAPTPASNYVGRLPGHLFMKTETGLELHNYIAPLAEFWFEGYKLAMEFKSGGRYGVGARQEVPGGSPFIPDSKREVWYRRDGPSGACQGLPRPWAMAADAARSRPDPLPPAFPGRVWPAGGGPIQVPWPLPGSARAP